MFKVDDRVERIGALMPIYMHFGQVIRVIPNKDGVDWLTEYEINFDDHMVAVFYESQLRLTKPSAEE